MSGGRLCCDLTKNLRQNLTLPRPDASHLLRIKQGQEPYKAVTGEIEMLLAEAEKAVVSTKLPEKPDQAFIDDLVARIYADQVRAIS